MDRQYIKFSRKKENGARSNNREYRVRGERRWERGETGERKGKIYSYGINVVHRFY